MTIPHEVSRDISKVFSYLSSHLWQSKSKGNECLRSFCLDLSRILPNPVFVKIGANDGVTGDPCSDILLANLNWRGLLIEPVPGDHILLRRPEGESELALAAGLVRSAGIV
jgi:hypothetical protein